MSVQVRTADFRRAVSIASKVVERRNTIPILETLRCRANGVLEVSGTDLDMTLSASVPREPGDDVSFAMMQAPRVAAALKFGGGDMTDLAMGKPRHVAVVSGAMSLNIGSLPADDFPNEAERPLTASFSATLSPEHIQEISRVSAAASNEVTRYYLNGVHLHHVMGTTYRAVATDGHRLCFVDLELPDASGDLTGIIIPNKAVSIIRDLGAKATGGIGISLGTIVPANREEGTAPVRASLPRLNLRFDVPGAAVAMQTRLIDGNFPDYQRIISAVPGNDKPMLFSTADIRRALRAVSGHSKNVRAVKIELIPDGARLSAAYIGIDLSLKIDLPCQHQHSGFEIGFNGNYLLALIDAAQGDELLLVAGDAAGPVLVRNPADTVWTGILMPMRID